MIEMQDAVIHMRPHPQTPLPKGEGRKNSEIMALPLLKERETEGEVYINVDT